VLFIAIIRDVAKKKVKRNFEENKSENGNKNRYKEKKNGRKGRVVVRIKKKGNERKMKQ